MTFKFLKALLTLKVCISIFHYTKTCLNSDIALKYYLGYYDQHNIFWKKVTCKILSLIHQNFMQFVTSLQTMYFFWLCVVMSIDLKMHFHPWKKMATHHTTHLYLLCIVWMFSCQLPLEKIVCKWLFLAYLSSHFNFFSPLLFAI